MLFFQILCILAHTFYTYISSYKFCPLKLFFYSEYMLQNLTYAFCVNRPFTRIRMNFIASAHNTCHFFIFKRVYGISRLFYLIFTIKNSSIKTTRILQLIQIFFYFLYCFYKFFSLFIFLF
mgnify:FL=1